jgi:arginine-tRNA-protein transferase
MSYESVKILAARLPDAPHACPYLAQHQACHEQYLFVEYDDAALCHVLEAGFRHFGHYFFRPACSGQAQAAWCGKCLPLRIPVDAFRPSHSQRRVLRRGAAIQINIDPPRYSSQKFMLYRKHKQRFPHEIQTQADLDTQADEDSFFDCFYRPAPCTREATYTLDGRLLGIGLIDVCSRALSSIYFFFDPEFSAYSPGTLSILHELEYARRLRIPYYYLGYTMQANPSLRYKMGFRPSEFFDGARWQPLRDASGAWITSPEPLATQPYTPLLI